MDIKGLKERITSGLIVWVLVTIFIQPVLSFTWKAILVVGGFVHQGYVDRIYRSAALGDRNGYGFLMLGAMFLAFPLISLFVMLHGLGEENESHIVVRTLHSMWRFMVALSFLVLFVLFTITQGTVEISSSFTQRLTVLAPAISDTEYKTLKARWASMRGKADYDALVAAMDKRATELGVALPPVRKP